MVDTYWSLILPAIGLIQLHAPFQQLRRGSEVHNHILGQCDPHGRFLVSLRINQRRPDGNTPFIVFTEIVADRRLKRVELWIGRAALNGRHKIRRRERALAERHISRTPQSVKRRALLISPEAQPRRTAFHRACILAQQVFALCDVGIELHVGVVVAVPEQTTEFHGRLTIIA